MFNPKMPPSKSDHFNHSFSSHLAGLIDVYLRQIVGAILFLGILLSALMIFSHPPSLKSGETDSWWIISLNVAHGEGYSVCLPQYFPFCSPTNQVTATREPAPVLLFALVARLSQDSLFAAELVEAMIYLLLIVAVYGLTRQWADSRSALMASLLWTLYLPALELIPQVSGDLFAALSTTLGILFTLRARRSHSTRDWILAGIWLGLAIVSRSATLVIALVVIVGQFLDGWRQGVEIKNLLKPVLLVSSLVFLIMAPWLIRNQMALGKPVIGSSLTGYNLYRHNYMIGESNYFRYVGSEEGAQAMKALLARRSDVRGNENEAQMDLVYREEALPIIKSHITQYALLSAYRFFPLWFDWKIAEAYGRQPNRYDYFIMVLQLALLALAFQGIDKRTGPTWPLWGSILTLSLAYMAVDARLLYVMPVMPLLISLSAVGGNQLLKRALNE